MNYVQQLKQELADTKVELFEKRTALRNSVECIEYALHCIENLRAQTTDAKVIVRCSLIEQEVKERKKSVDIYNT